MKGKQTYTALFILFGALAPSSAWAQTASLTGTITDPSGAVIVGATAKAQNLETGVERSVTTGDTGIYRIANLSPGHYTLTVEMQGFATFQVSNLQLTVDQTLTIDAK